MNRILKAFSLVAIIALLASCKKDDGPNIAPPRDYGVQYNADRDSINKFLDTHYLVVDPVTLKATFPVIANGETSIRNQTEYPLLSHVVRRNDVDYTIYYLNFRTGVGESPTFGDNINFTFRGTLLNGTQFDYRENVSSEVPLYSLIKGWWDILPLFKGGVYENTNPQDPATFTDYGAGAMFLPSGLAFFNTPTSNLIPAYAPVVFSFQLMDVTLTDVDNDGIPNRYEIDPRTDPDTGKPYTLETSDTDGDGVLNFQDSDDDGDGRPTKAELKKPGTTNEYYTYQDIYDEEGNLRDGFGCGSTSTERANLAKYLNNDCLGGE